MHQNFILNRLPVSFQQYFLTIILWPYQLHC